MHAGKSWQQEQLILWWEELAHIWEDQSKGLAYKLWGPPFPPSSVLFPPVRPISQCPKTMLPAGDQVTNHLSWGGNVFCSCHHTDFMRMPDLQTNVLPISSLICDSNVREERGFMKLKIRPRTRITWPKGTRDNSESMLQRCSQYRMATSFLPV